MRCAVRNQHKLIASLGTTLTDLILNSVNEHFRQAQHIIEQTYEGEPFNVIRVVSINPSEYSAFEFYVIEKKYDMYRLAYKQAIKITIQ